MILRHITVDCADPYRLATFWSRATGWPVSDVDEPGDDEVLVEAPSPVPGILFIRVPEGKAVKNRLHLDLRPTDQAAEVARLEALGARRVDVGQGSDVTWVVMADPDGNEFCVLRAYTPEELAEIAAEG